MDKREEVLIEGDLFDALRAFHDLDDREKRNQYVKEYVLEFCSNNNIDPREAIDKLIIMFEDRRKSTIYKYEHYKNDPLDKIVFDDNEK